MNSRAKHLIVGIITIVAGATVLQWVLAVLALANPFPFGGCLSPMWESSRYSCIVDIAIRTNKPVLCKSLLGDQQNYINCVTAIALVERKASVCVQWLASDRSLKEDAGAHLCLASLADGLKDSSLCDQLSNDKWRRICLSAFADAMNQVH